MEKEEIELQIKKILHWRHQIELPFGIVTPGLINTQKEWTLYQMPNDLHGKRVLDIGCSDGYYSFQSEKLGASEVVAIDDKSSLYWNQGSAIGMVREILNSEVKFMHKSVYDLNKDEQGEFDVVFFLNVIYHLRYPLLGLDKIRAVMRSGATMLYKSYYSKNIEFKIFGKLAKLQIGNKPLAQFYPTNELAGDYTNWWGPNIPAHRAMIESSGFKIEQELKRTYDRIYYKCIAV